MTLRGATLRSLGQRTDVLFRSGARGAVHAVYSRAMALETDGGELLWIDPAPEALSARGATIDFLPHARRASRWWLAEHTLEIDGCPATRWSDAEIIADTRVVSAPFARLQLAARSALIRSLLARQSGEPIDEYLSVRCNAFVEAITHGDGPDAARALVGLGRGLTPAGDDFLGGFALARRRLARELDAAVVRAICEALDGTTPVSRAFLAARLDGEATLAEARMLRAMTEPDVDAAGFAAHAATVASFGATSGRDLLAGVLAATDSECFS